VNYIQQGDVLLKETKKPSKIKIQKTDLLWKGANHHHRMKGEFRIAKNEAGDTFVHSKGATLFHEEHKDISVAPGFYQLSIVQEYDHFLEESRAVID
jgi:hypothetical protein